MPPVNELEHVSGLSVKAQACVEHYLVYGEKAGAYRHGFGRGKAKEKVFEAMVHRFFEQPKVMAEIQRRRAAVSAAVDVKIEDVVRRLYQFGFTDLPGIMDYEDGVMTLEAFKRLTPAQRAAIKKFEFQQDPPTASKNAEGEVILVPGATKVKIELEDRRASVVDLGKHLGMWEKKKQGALVEAPLFNIIMPMPATGS